MSKPPSKLDQARALRERRFAETVTPPEPIACPRCAAKDVKIAELEAALADCDTSLSKRRAAAAKAQRTWRRNQKAKKDQTE